MYKEKNILAIITARGGSKGIPHKNIVDLCGKPLIAWTIEAAKKSEFIDRLILSSEDAEIIKVAKEYGCEVPFVRPANLATDTATSVSVVEHAINSIDKRYDYFVLLQPTSPLRSTEDINGAISKCIDLNADSCVSVCEPKKSPYWMFTINSAGKLSPLFSNLEFTRRQDIPATYCLNGAVYVVSTDWFIKNKKFIGENTVPYIMPETRSLDIDVPLDIVIAEVIINVNIQRPTAEFAVLSK